MALARCVFSGLLPLLLTMACHSSFAHSKTPRAGDVVRECDGCPEMAVVPAGAFMMGSPPGEQWRESYEGPQRLVRIPAPLLVSRFEITFDEWDGCVASGHCPPRSDEGWGRGRRPVINLSWYDAKRYVDWLAQRTGQRYRLLSEAEWEYVARAGTSTRYHWGDAVGEGKATCDRCGSSWDSTMTAPVGSFKANAFGLYDIHGNAWEWVEDVWHESYEGAPSDGSAWVVGGDAGRRVLRGGAWGRHPWYLRSAARSRFFVEHGLYFFGLRVARTLDVKPDG